MRKFILLFAIFTAMNANGQTDGILDFDGIDDYVNLDLIAPSIPISTGTFTIEFWTRYNAEDNTDYGAIFAANTQVFGNRFLIRAAGTGDATSDGIVVFIREGMTNQYIYGDIPVADGKCHHIAFTYSLGVCSLYVDGVLDKTAIHQFWFQNNDHFSLGQEYDVGGFTSNFFDGSIDDLRIWQSARTPDEIVDNMHSEFDISDPLIVSHFKFNPPGLIPGGNNFGILVVHNSAEPDENGDLINFARVGPSSNFLIDPCSDNSIHFDGGNDFIDLNSIEPTMSSLTDFTVEFWALVDETVPDYSVFFSANSNTGGNRFIIRNNGVADPAGTGVVVYARVGFFNYYLRGTTNIEDGSCHHIAVSYDFMSNSFSLYIDGVLDIAGSPPLALSFLSNDLFSLGQEYDAGLVTSNFLVGYMDDFRIWDEVRTADQIVDMMIEEYTEPVPGLVTYFNFNQGISGGDNTEIPFLENLTAPAEIGLHTTLTMMTMFSNLVAMPCWAPDTGTFTVPPTNQKDLLHKKEIFKISDGNTSTKRISNDSNKITAYSYSNNLKIETKFSVEKANIRIYGMNGRLCFNKYVDKLTSQDIDISFLNSGIYIIHISNEFEKYSSKFIK